MGGARSQLSARFRARCNNNAAELQRLEDPLPFRILAPEVPAPTVESVAERQQEQKLPASVPAQPDQVQEQEQKFVPSKQFVYDRLVKRFGFGGKPAARKALYLKLCNLVERDGEPAMDAVAEAAAQAAGAHDPGRYFCKAVLWKLRERGLLLDGVVDAEGGDIFGRKRGGL